MFDLWLLIAVVVLTAAASYRCGWIRRGRRLARTGPASEGESSEWQILEINCRDNDRTREWYRHLTYTKFRAYDEAVREAKSCEDKDTLENKFSTEYVVVKAV